MKSSYIFIALILAFLVRKTSGKVYTRCQLAKLLLELEFPKNLLREWVCLVEVESERNSHRINLLKNGSKSYGLFQISDEFWCETDEPLGACRVKCSDLTTDLEEAAECAKWIFHQFGFGQWEKFLSQCRNIELPNLDLCGIKY